MDLINDLKKLKCGVVIENVDLKKYTTYRLEGKALVLVMPKNEKELIKLIKYIKENKKKYKVIGNGSNLIFCKEFYDGILIKLSEFDYFEVDGNNVTVASGYDLIKLSIKTARMGLSGLEFASGIPGTVGGAIFMNAGAYNSDMGYVISKIKVLTPELKIKTLYNRELNFHYRSSYLQKHPGYICLEGTFALKNGDADEIIELISNRKKRRLESQPLDYPSAGSVFRNPKDDFAGRLIEEIGYKGKTIGGAMVSKKHANFIINIGHASGEDIKSLIYDIKNKVKEKYDIELKVEQEFVE